MPILSPSYAFDLNRHHPKLKFLFKVGFYGFLPDVRDFYFYVHRVDKPKVKLHHQDINYYNFRTRVLTHVTYEPLNMEFLDEIGNTVNDFFVAYLQSRSGTGSGGRSIHDGFGDSTSSRPYLGNNPGYAAGQRICLEQIYANGTQVNRFNFWNPRIESFDFNELNMEESAGSMMTIQFSYDALTCETSGDYENPTWGETDLMRGGGPGAAMNGGASSLGETAAAAAQAAAAFSGNGIAGASRSTSVYQGGLISGGGFGGGSGSSSLLSAGSSANQQVPADLSRLSSNLSNPPLFNQKSVVGSSMDRLSANIQDTLHSITSGDNLQFNGAAPGTFNDRRYSGEVLTDGDQGSVVANQIFPG